MKRNKKATHYTREDIADAHIISADPSCEEREDILLEFGEIRKKMAASMSDKDRLIAAILQLRFQIEDSLTSDVEMTPARFCFFLKEYITRLHLKNKEFASQIGIEPSELSQLLNAHRKPNDKILVRLELHSSNYIDALLWHRILARDKEYELLHNVELRVEEKKHVKAFFAEEKR